MISGFRREVDEICALLGYCAAYSGNCLQTFRNNLSVPSSRTDRLYRNVFKNYHYALRNTPAERIVCGAYRSEKVTNDIAKLKYYISSLSCS